MDRPASVARKSVGAKLVAARAEKKLEREEAARRASVPLRFATMLEEGEYPLIADPAYLVPYLRRYATSLGLVAEALVLAFHAENEAADRVAAVQIARIARQQPPRRGFRRWIGAGAVSAAAVAGIAYAIASGVSLDGVLAMLPFRGGTNAVAYSSSPEGTEDPSPAVEVPRVVAIEAAEDPAPAEERAPAAEAKPAEAFAPAPPARPNPPSRVAAVAPSAPPAEDGERLPPEARAAVRAQPAPPVAAPPASPAAAEPADRGRVAAAKPSSVAAPAAASAPRASAEASENRRGHRLELTATARQVWVWVAIDGGRRRAVELREGNRVSFDAEREILLSLDDAGGVEATLDGRRLPALGPLGQTRRNVRLP